MVPLIIDTIKTARPRQWLKNLTLYAALVFSGHVLPSNIWIKDFWIVSEAVLAFTLVACGVYFLNDLIDRNVDKAHPFKKNRPIAAGRIKVSFAVACILLFLGSGTVWSFVLNQLFGILVVGYVVLQLLYSFWLKNLEVFDVFSIALGFFIRVIAGAAVINAHLSIWFLLCVVSTSLFLAVGKRRAELAILDDKSALLHRKVMAKYSTALLDVYVAMFGTAAFLAWALYSFNFYDQGGGINPSGTVIPILGDIVSRTLTVNKWLMATIPVVIFGIMRYIRIIYDGSKAESPERVFMTDKVLLGCLALWSSIVLVVLYGGVR